MERLREHYETAKALVPEENIVGVFLIGSQNYHLDTDESDVDTRVLVVPTIADFTYHRTPLSFEHTVWGDEHINVVDIRLYFQQLKKVNPNTFELLFTEYYIINERFATEWKKLCSLRESIVRINPVGTVKTIAAMARSYYKNYQKGKDVNKSIANILRLEQMLYVFFDTAPYKDVFVPSNAEVLVDIKEGRIPDEDIADYADESFTLIEALSDKFIAENEEEVNNGVVRAMCVSLEEIIRKQITFELEKINGV